VVSWYILIGALLGGPLWILITVAASRRIWRSARRLRRRSHGHDMLVEIGQLAGGLAHEIKNPLSTINVNLQLLGEDLDRLDPDEHGRTLRRLKNVQQEVERLRRILEQFLQFARRYELSRETTDLRQLVEELSDFFVAQAEASGVLMRTVLPDEPATVSIDVRLFKQALLNLMINAVQAMPDGGELLTRLETRRGQAVIEIIDTGPGMDKEKCGRVFDAYYSTKEGGSGLGLPTTRRIVHEHGGTIQVESEPGKGTRFVIALPLSET